MVRTNRRVKGVTYETTSEITIEASVVCYPRHPGTRFEPGEDAWCEIEKCWLVYDPDPHGDIELRDMRLVRVAFEPHKLGDAEREHIEEQALEDARVNEQAAREDYAENRRDSELDY